MMAPTAPLRFFEAMLLAYRRTWRGTVISSFVNPILFLAAMGTSVHPTVMLYLLGFVGVVLTTLTRADPIWVRFSLSEAEFARVRGADARDLAVELELANGQPYPEEAKINFAGSTVDAATGTVQMRAELATPRLQLLPGQFVRVRVVSGVQQAIVVPQAAVQQNEGGRFVWVAADGKATRRAVTLGVRTTGFVEILEGVQAGEQVVVGGQERLGEGAPVMPQVVDRKAVPDTARR